jgi:membrane-associated phospholipid phosphatase
MSARAGTGKSQSYVAQFVTLVGRSVTQLVRPPSHARRAEAARRLARHALWLTAIGGIAVVALMFALDVWEIDLMPPRGSAGLWPVRILTDFGKAALVLWSLAIALVVVAVISPRWRGAARTRLLALGTHLQFVFFAVLIPVLTGEVIKWVVGRGRPFVGGEANAFNFRHFAGTEAYASFPSAHAITSVALAFAVAAVWPRARVAMAVYALLIIGSRLVLLAHHPSDVVAGAVIGVIGAMFVRYWFAARDLGFAIEPDGTIVPLMGNPKRVARGASAP